MLKITELRIHYIQHALIMMTLAIGVLLCSIKSVAHSNHSHYQIDGYWLYHQFMHDYPDQANLVAPFEQQVLNSAVPLKAKQSQEIKIALIVPGNQISDYWVRNQRALEARLEELGIAYDIDDAYAGVESMTVAQMNVLVDAMDEQVDYIISTFYDAQHQKLLEHILSDSNVKLILLNITSPLKRWDGRQPFFYAGFDHILGTEILAREFKRRFPEGADYALLHYLKGYISEARGGAFIEGMNYLQQYRLLSSYYTDATQEGAYSNAVDLLNKKPHLDFIYASSTDIAIGATQAVIDRKKEGIVINGWGGGSKELEYLQKGYLDFTVMRMNDDTGVAIAEAIKNDLEGKKVPLIFSGQFELVTKEDTPLFIQQLKQRAFRYSDQ
ncbi:substrate-binding domain-containing protein [Vibrio sp.]|nr:substrate-binding domain-containing protein [Vibrio sp.]